MRTRKTLTISLPPAMLKELDARFPVVAATKAEIARIGAGRAEIKKGEYVTIDELLRDLPRP